MKSIREVTTLVKMNRFLSFVNFIVTFFIPVFLYGQDIATIKGNIRSKAGNSPIPYISVGIKGKPFGTIADSLGHFILSVDRSGIEEKDTIVFSGIGFSSFKLSVKEAFNSNLNIMLTASPSTQLKEVVINQKKDKIKVYGRTAGKMILNARAYSSYPKISDVSGREQATVLDIDDNILLKEVNFLVIRNNFTDVTFRLNIYTVNDNLPDKLISTREVLYEIREPRGWKTIDLGKYNIRIAGQKKIAVALQLVKSALADGDTLKHSYLIPSFPSPLKKSYFREKSESQWVQVKASYLYVNVKAYKLNGKHNESAFTESPDEEQSREYMNLMIGNNPQIGRTISVDNARIYYEIYGEGEPLFLLHGNNEGINSFREQIEPLSKRFRVIAMDTRGQGNSSNSYDGAYTYQLFSKDLIQVMDSLHIEKANILGWSDGGNTGLATAINYPERVNRLVVMGSNAFSGTDAIEDTVIQRFESRARKYQLRNDEQSANEFKLAELVLKEPHFTADNLNAIRCPTLILAGEKDVIKRKHTEFLHKQIPNSKMVILPGADHYAPIKSSALFNSQVLDFFVK